MDAHRRTEKHEGGRWPRRRHPGTGARPHPVSLERPLTARTVFEQLAVRLHKRPLSTCELTILQSTAGVMGNLSSVPEGVVGVNGRCEENVLTRHETILIHINTILKSSSVLSSQQTIDM